MHTEKRIPMGDRHFGKQVELIAQGNNKYLLKPRSADTEKAFEAFLLTLKKEGFPFLPGAEHVIEECAQGYKSRYEEHLPATTQEDIHLYFKRCGALIFIAYLLGASDLHYENIIASRNTPVVVDCETIIAGQTEAPQQRLANLSDTVLASHLLPYWKSAGDTCVLVSGLISEVPGAANQLVFKGKICYIYAYEAQVQEGFEAAYRFSLEHEEVILRALTQFEGCTFRMILRPSKVYDSFMRIGAVMQHDKAEQGIRELLSVGYRKDVREKRLQQMQPVLEKELGALLSGNIPLFHIRYNAHALYCGEEVLVEDFLALTPQQSVKQRLAALSFGDMQAQKRMISQSFAAVRPVQEHMKTPCREGLELETCFQRIEEGYIASLAAGWMQLDRDDDTSCLFFRNCGFGLYSGTAGILCAYAAMYHSTKDDKYLHALMAHYQHFKNVLVHLGTPAMRAQSISLQSGVSGVINALLHIYALTGERCFYEDGAALFEAIDTSEVPQQGDLLGGCAGLALVLPKIHTQKSADLAKRMLPRLVAEEPVLTGAAHGAAGLALAICAAQQAADTDAYNQRILELMQSENTYYSAACHNWQDLRYSDKTVFMNGWCSGAAGVAMVRKYIAQATKSTELKKLCRLDIARATENLTAHIVLPRDSLCCGNAARLMALSYLGEQNEDLYQHLCNAVRSDSLQLFHPHKTCDENFGLMQGLAGIAYALAMYQNPLSGGMLL